MESLWHHTQIFEVLTWSSVWWPHRHLGNPAFSAYWLQTHCSWLAVASIKWMFEEDVYDKFISQSRRMLLVLTPLLLCGFVVIRRWLYLSPLSQNPCLHYSVPQLFWEHCPPLYTVVFLWILTSGGVVQPWGSLTLLLYPGHSTIIRSWCFVNCDFNLPCTHKHCDW